MSRAIDLKLQDDETVEVTFTVNEEVACINLGPPTEGLIEAMVEVVKQLQRLRAYQANRSVH